MKTILLSVLLFVRFCYLPVWAQNPQYAPDTTLNNLVHAPGYSCSAWGEIPVQKFGTGPKTLLLLPGWGFDARVFQPFIERNLETYTMYAFTLPGYGDTHAYPMPAADTSYAQGNWLRGVTSGILRLVERENLRRPVLIAHFSVASHLALELAAKHPDLLEKVVLIGGPATFYNPPPYDTLGYAGRVRSVDKYLAPRWFKTVNRETWVKGNYPPGTYAIDSLLGRQLFEQANVAPLPVQIRYLCEYWAADYTFYEKIQIPVLAVLPSFSPELLENTTYQFVKWHTSDWDKLAAKNPNIELARVEGSGCNVMQEKPETLDKLLEAFLKNGN